MMVWWKIDNLLLSNQQMRVIGLYPPGQLKLWMDGIYRHTGDERLTAVPAIRQNTAQGFTTEPEK